MAARADRRLRGRLGEDLAEAHLLRSGFRILARNLHLRHAEIDLVALDGSTLCFVEVRLRSGDAYGTPEESLGPRKLLRLRRAAAQVLASAELPRHSRVRFDLIAIDAAHDPPILRHLRDIIS
jgi:putative endonuclease